MADSDLILEEDLLALLPATLRTELLTAYAEILRNYRERRWEPSELNGGKLCEIAYSILQGHVNNKFPKKSSKPRNMVDACRDLENATSSFPRSVRIQIPRMIVALYEIRNNRGVGHVGGDVDPNHMDATCVVEMSKWLLSELVRVFHDVTTEEATAAVDALVERTVPTVWQVGENLRVLDPKMSMREKTLLLLYHRRGPVPENDLRKWVEHSNPSTYRRDVLKKAHQVKLVEYDASKKTVEISPLGIAFVEDNLLG
ncbi:MAG: hypothetical protein M3198_00295 [Actinomycetota bacterium]|nr:hypothetical protein [Actinomycetota bacterium]